jgi:hypothetical protein
MTSASTQITIKNTLRLAGYRLMRNFLHTKERMGVQANGITISLPAVTYVKLNLLTSKSVQLSRNGLIVHSHRKMSRTINQKYLSNPFISFQLNYSSYTYYELA